MICCHASEMLSKRAWPWFPCALALDKSLDIFHAQKLLLTVAALCIWEQYILTHIFFVQSGTSQTSSPVSFGPLSSALQQKPFVGQSNSSCLLEIYIHPMVFGTILTTEVERHRPGPDCLKSLVITGSFDGIICDEVVTTG
jgi:hypothetical protein